MAVTLDNDGSFRVEIDPLNLHEEWAGQSLQFYNASMKVADCQKELDDARTDLDDAKADLAKTKAEVGQHIRENPSDYGLEKIKNETVVEEFVLKSAEYTAALKSVNHISQKINILRHKCAQAEAAVNALEHRKRALTKMTDLFIHAYYQEARMEGGEPSEMARIWDRGKQRKAQLDESRKEERREEGNG